MGALLALLWRPRMLSVSEVLNYLGRVLIFFFSVGEPPGREPPCCTSQSEEENLLVRLAPHPSLANASEDLVYLCRDKPRHLGCDGTEQQRWVSAHTAGSEVSKPDIVSARTWQISWAVPQENTAAKC